MNKAQTTLKNAKVLRQFKPYTFESFIAPNGNTQYVLTNGWTCNYIIFYGNGKWSGDWQVTRKDILNYLNKQALKH